MAVLHHPLAEKFEEALRRIPRPGGNGCHQALLGAANYGVMIGLDEEELVRLIAAAIPAGDREVPEREIRDAVRKAFHDHSVRQSGGMREKTTPKDAAAGPAFDVRAFMLHHLKLGAGATADHIIAQSPVPIPADPAEHTALVIERLYGQRLDECLCIGDRHESDVRPVGYWLDRLKSGPIQKPHIIPNTFTGTPGPKKDGRGMSLRADSCVKSFMHCVVEFDTMPHYLLHDETTAAFRAENDLEGVPFLQSWQLAFWATVQLPVVALIDSGGKSIHAWLKVEDCPDNACWEQTIEMRLYKDFLVPLGVDPACRNESRLSRLPGSVRPETGRCQRLLYFCPEGRPVCVL